MEYRYPKTILVGSTTFEMVYDRKTDVGSASFSYPYGGKPAYVMFALKRLKADPLAFLNCIIHEFKEIIQIEQGVQMKNRSQLYTFSYTHMEHDDCCSRLAGILSQFIK